MWSTTCTQTAVLRAGVPTCRINCIWHLTTHQCPGASSHMAWPKSFQPESGECEGCSHVRQHVSGCLPEKSGGHQIARNERFSNRHMSVVREEGNDTSSPLPSRPSECVSGPSVLEGSNPQDRVEPKPDRSRQDFSCLGQTIRGSVCPREEHEIGNIRLRARFQPVKYRPSGLLYTSGKLSFLPEMFGQKRQTRVSQHPNNKFRRLLCAFI